MISALEAHVAEMICLWEASFPASENYFQLHQIMDLVSSMKIKKKSNPVQWDWQHGTAQPKKSTELVKGPKLTAPVKGPEPVKKK